MAAASAKRPSRIWVDCDDLIGHFDGWSTPTGICRVQLEIIPHLLALAPERIVLCSIGRTAREFQIVAPDRLDRLRSRSEEGAQRQTGRFDALARAWRFVTLRGWRRASRLAMRVGLTRPSMVPTRGDWLLAMGGTWSNPGFATAVAELKASHGMRLAHLVHDLLPATHPTLVADRQVARFAAWIRYIAALSDRCLTPSRHAADALRTYLAGIGRADVPVTPIAFGSGFSHPGGATPAGPLLPGPYALFVSTIEVRKNHLFLARVWQRLMAKHGADAIPTLLLVGRFGWKTQPFARFLKETGNLDGKIVVLSNLSDVELHNVYARCLFTVFPSLGEGWGLPVAESLSHGKACVAAQNTSIPEVGGEAVDYFDQLDEDSAMAAIERMLFQPGYRESREEWIRANYRPRSWADAAGTILEALPAAHVSERADADR